MLNGMRLDRVCWVTPVRREGYVRPRYEGWHQSWHELEESKIPEWMRLVSGWDGPTSNRLDGEVPLPVLVTFKEDNVFRCVQTSGNISWQWPQLPPGRYYKLCGRTAQGELLWEMPITPEIEINGSSAFLYINRIVIRVD